MLCALNAHRFRFRFTEKVNAHLSAPYDQEEYSLETCARFDMILYRELKICLHISA